MDVSTPRTTSGHRRVDRRVVLLIGIAIFAQESVWNFYDAQVPASLQRYISSVGLIGAIMGMDNVIGVLVQPLMGHLSDKWQSARGGRLPFILIGAPIAAVPFVLIPWATDVVSLMVCIFSFALVANGFKAITEALLPDYVDAPNRSKANGFIKIATSLTIAVSAAVSIFVVDTSLKLAFAIPAALMLVAFYGSAFFLYRRRRMLAAEDRAVSRHGDMRDGNADGDVDFSKLRNVYAELFTDRDRTRVLLMLGIFCFAGTWSALRSLTTPYGIDVLGLSRGASGGLALPGSVAFLLAAAPIALVSERVGQVKMICYGAALFTCGLVVGFLFRTHTGTAAAIAICAVGYAAFSINAAVALWNLAPSDKVLGAYTGLYTVAASSGAALGPALLGTAIDFTGWNFMMLDAAVLALVTVAVFAIIARSNRRRTANTPSPISSRRK
ncbi:MFS transporter [Rhodococcus sp. 077-4]|uniref:MFS transporter n=1 Tax=Rhodococcus sp. 077-4 TaxID=2789271 RepID=UPI0039F63DFA